MMVTTGDEKPDELCWIVRCIVVDGNNKFEAIQTWMKKREPNFGKSWGAAVYATEEEAKAAANYFNKMKEK